MLPRWGAVIAPASAHINVDEAGGPAPERVGGIKILAVPAPDGKLTPELVDHEAWGWGDEHRAQPLAISLTQSTEVGTVVHSGRDPRPRRPRARTRDARPHGRRPDRERGGRTGNAPARADPRRRRGRAELRGNEERGDGGRSRRRARASATEGLEYLRKLDMQLASKLRFVSAQLLALLADDPWLRNARHANAMARRLRDGIDAGVANGEIRDVVCTQPTEANAVFAVLPPRRRSGCGTASASTTGAPPGRRPIARCGGCAASTRRRTTSRLPHRDRS